LELYDHVHFLFQFFHSDVRCFIYFQFAGLSVPEPFVVVVLNCLLIYFLSNPVYRAFVRDARSTLYDNDTWLAFPSTRAWTGSAT
jgi:hypothetical protein